MDFRTTTPRERLLETAKHNAAWELNAETPSTHISAAARFAAAGIISVDDFVYLHLVRLACRQPEPTWRFMRQYGYTELGAADRFYSLYEQLADGRGIIYFGDRTADPRDSRVFEMLENIL